MGFITPDEPDYYFTFDQLMLDIKNDTLKIEK